MSSRKKRQTQVPAISDYESDANNLAYRPPTADRTPDELNLSVLQRHDTSILALEYIAPYVVLYTFLPDTAGWEKTGVEGTAFVCRLRPTQERRTRYSIMILNRRGLNNFQLELSGDVTVESADDITILQSKPEGKVHIYGFWVFSEPLPSSTSEHREAFTQTIRTCAQEVKRGEEEDIPNTLEDSQASVPMDRKISLKEIFGQQRQQDDSWSVRSHSPVQPFPHFTTSADTDFFRASKASLHTHSGRATDSAR